jgi:hypothetical protein
VRWRRIILACLLLAFWMSPARAQWPFALPPGGVIGNPLGITALPQGVGISTMIAGINPGGTTILSQGQAYSTAGVVATLFMSPALPGAGTLLMRQSPCRGLFSPVWLPIMVVGRPGKWYVPACQ